MQKIKFGTDGWRAIIAKEFTVENVARVSEATGKWLLKNYDNPTVFVGHDCRFAGALFHGNQRKGIFKPRTERQNVRRLCFNTNGFFSR